MQKPRLDSYFIIYKLKKKIKLNKKKENKQIQETEFLVCYIVLLVFCVLDY